MKVNTCPLSCYNERGDWRGEHRELLNDRIHAVTEDDLVNISYTSGTTAEPKGVSCPTGLRDECVAIRFFDTNSGILSDIIVFTMGS